MTALALQRLAVSLTVALAGLWLLQLVPAAAVLAGPLNLATAVLTEIPLQALGMAVWRDGPVLSHAGGFAGEIDLACTAAIPAAVLGAIWLAQPPSRPRRSGLAVALALLMLLNQLRLMSLVALGVYAPDWFDLAHGSLWPGLQVMVVAGYAFLWHRGQRDAACAPYATPVS